MFVPEEKRTLYHAGLAHGANHLVTLVTQAMELLAASGAEDPAATLRPLLSAALDNPDVDASLEAAAAKVFASELVWNATDDLVQVASVGLIRPWTGSTWTAR